MLLLMGEKKIQISQCILSMQNLTDLFMLLLFNWCLHRGTREERNRYPSSVLLFRIWCSVHWCSW